MKNKPNVASWPKGKKILIAFWLLYSTSALPLFFPKSFDSLFLWDSTPGHSFHSSLDLFFFNCTNRAPFPKFQGANAPHSENTRCILTPSPQKESKRRMSLYNSCIPIYMPVSWHFKKRRELQQAKTLHDFWGFFWVQCNLQQQDINESERSGVWYWTTLVGSSLSIIDLWAGILLQRSHRKSHFHKQEVEWVALAGHGALQYLWVHGYPRQTAAVLGVPPL